MDGAKNTYKNTCKIFFALNCDKPLITKFVRRKILHETMVRANYEVLESYHNFMRNFTSHKFFDKRLITVWWKKNFARVFCMCFWMRVFAPSNRCLMTYPFCWEAAGWRCRHLAPCPDRRVPSEWARTVRSRLRVFHRWFRTRDCGPWCGTRSTWWSRRCPGIGDTRLGKIDKHSQYENLSMKF